jgi:hypothetical protein
MLLWIKKTYKQETRKKKRGSEWTTLTAWSFDCKNGFSENAHLGLRSPWDHHFEISKTRKDNTNNNTT